MVVERWCWGAKEGRRKEGVLAMHDSSNWRVARLQRGSIDHAREVRRWSWDVDEFRTAKSSG